jgi:hypothetical protein
VAPARKQEAPLVNPNLLPPEEEFDDEGKAIDAIDALT